MMSIISCEEPPFVEKLKRMKQVQWNTFKTKHVSLQEKNSTCKEKIAGIHRSLSGVVGTHFWILLGIRGNLSSRTMIARFICSIIALENTLLLEPCWINMMFQRSLVRSCWDRREVCVKVVSFCGYLMYQLTASWWMLEHSVWWWSLIRAYSQLRIGLCQLIFTYM